MHLSDGFGRTFKYLRLSITDVCNFRCSYCLPEGYKKCAGPRPLSADELVRAARAFSDLGLSKIRITGGEPTVRSDFIDIVSAISDLPSVKTLALTTNGYRLKDQARGWRAAGIDAINVSLDSLDPATFRAVTGHDRCRDVIAGIEESLSLGFKAVKVNVVHMKGVNDKEIDDFINLTRTLPVSVRFIELMETGDHVDFFQRHHLPVEQIADRLCATGWTQKLKAADAGPSLEFVHPDFSGSVGLIAPYSKDFCTSCNRLRFSSLGNLHLCLFGSFGIPLRALLQHDDQIDELKQKLRVYVRQKQPGHQLHDRKTGNTGNLSAIGG